jgi:hypothetical protein
MHKKISDFLILKFGYKFILLERSSMTWRFNSLLDILKESPVFCNQSLVQGLRFSRR